jgi:hypothetical protein
MPAVALYAVARGRQVGVFQSWEECKQSVSGFPGARFRKFASAAAAQQFLLDNGAQVHPGIAAQLAAAEHSEADELEVQEIAEASSAASAARARRAAAEEARQRIALRFLSQFPVPGAGGAAEERAASQSSDPREKEGKEAAPPAGEGGPRKEAQQQLRQGGRKRYGHRQRFRHAKRRRREELNIAERELDGARKDEMEMEK